MACFAPKARANCVTALPIRSSDRWCQNSFACPKTSQSKSHLRGEIRDRNTCGTHVVDIVRNQAKVFFPYGNPLTRENRMVQRRDASRGDSHKYFPLCNRRFWKFDELQPLITTKCFGSHCTHIISPLIQAFIPPSTVRFAPVMYEDSGPATNATRAATSSTCP